MNLTETFTLRGAIPEPVDYGDTPWGPRIFVGAVEGRIEGDRLKADIVPSRGGDWLLRIEGSDGAYNVPDIRQTLRTDDGELILLRAHGFMELNDAWRRAFEEGVASDFGDHYLRAVFTFETGSATYGWLNTRLFLGEGRFPAPNTIEYRIFEVA
jgi:hypothetical protein